MLVNVHDAKSQLSKLIAAAEAGDDVVIARKGKPAVRLVPVKPGGFQFDTLAHLVDTVPEFDEPMDEDELALWEGKCSVKSKNASVAARDFWFLARRDDAVWQAPHKEEQRSPGAKKTRRYP